MNAEDCRDGIAALLTATRTVRDGWTPIAELAPRMRELGISNGQGRGDLRWLLATGRIERRDSPTTMSRRGPPAAEYRLAFTTGEHVSRTDRARAAGDRFNPPIWTVADEDGSYRETYPGALGCMATSPATLAERWAEKHHVDYDWTKEMTAVVTSPNGEQTRWVVCVESRPTFTAVSEAEVQQIERFNDGQRDAAIKQLLEENRE